MSVNNVNIVSLQEQIDFLHKEYERCKLVYNFLATEFGRKNLHLVDKEITNKMKHYRSILQSLHKFQSLENNGHGN